MQITSTSKVLDIDAEGKHGGTLHRIEVVIEVRLVELQHYPAEPAAQAEIKVHEAVSGILANLR